MKINVLNKVMNKIRMQIDQLGFSRSNPSINAISVDWSSVSRLKLKGQLKYRIGQKFLTHSNLDHQHSSWWSNLLRCDDMWSRICYLLCRVLCLPLRVCLYRKEVQYRLRSRHRSVSLHRSMISIYHGLVWLLPCLRDGQNIRTLIILCCRDHPRMRVIYFLALPYEQGHK